MIEADVLSRGPKAVLQEYCTLSRIPYHPKALNWQAGKTIPAWKEWRGWHIDTLNSFCIYPPVEQEKLNIPLPAQPKKIALFYNRLKSLNRILFRRHPLDAGI